MFPNIGKAIKKFAKILEEDEDCREVFPEGCFRIAYKRGHKNLKEIIAPSSFAFASHGDIKQRNHRDEIGYCKKCNKCGRSNRGRKRENDLNNCSVMEEGETFYSTVTKETYKIRQEIDCRSKNIIYLVSCVNVQCRRSDKQKIFRQGYLIIFPISLKESKHVGLLSILWKRVDIQ